ncbi:MAG: hypothetical protein QOG34_2027 [Frankiaceae bacterium]|nr:hypothetical protein [Frankiaceae bacterium]
MSGQLRVALDRRRLSADPGSIVTFTLDITNTSEVIDGISARVLGVDAERVTSRPQVLSLFPDSNGELTLSIELPDSYPAGTHPLTVALDSHTSGTTELVDLELTVAPVPRVQVQPRPAVVRTGRRAHFVVDVGNRGNVPLDVALTAADSDRSLKLRFSRTSVTVPAGSTKPVNLDSRSPRHLFGNDIDRPFTVHAEATAPVTMPGAVPLAVLENAGLIHRQRPVIARGVLTTIVLVTIVALWAGAFLFGLTKVFNTDPVTKAAPASFFVATGVAGLAAESTPGDVLAKGGPLPAGVGGVIAGRVVSTTSGDGVGRIVVEALRPSRTGLKLVTSSATQADGSYVVIGLFPGSYYLRFSAVGYHTTWYPGAPTQLAARLLSAAPQQVTKAASIQVAGFPATISGQVDAGQVATPVRTTVIVRPLTGTSDKPVVKPVLTDAKGNYTVGGLPAPASYQVSFITAGYLASTLSEDVGGGQHRYEPVTRLSAGAGTISGVVTDGHGPIGGVTVSTTVNGQTFTTCTPTVGRVGHFSLGGLPTPGLYILTFRRDASTSTSKDVTLSAGGSAVINNVVLRGGTDAVLGKVVDHNGAPVGGATITISGAPIPISATSLTTGDAKGTYAITGLPVPGVYTLTVSLAGFQPVTLPLKLDGITPPTVPPVTMSSALGTITGVVEQPTSGGPIPSVGATITVTDGQHLRTTLTVGAGGGATSGSYLMTGLAPGWYTVTATRDGYAQVTALVHVGAGDPVSVPLTLGALH